MDKGTIKYLSDSKEAVENPPKNLNTSETPVGDKKVKPIKRPCKVNHNKSISQVDHEDAVPVDMIDVSVDAQEECEFLEDLDDEEGTCVTK